MQVKVAEFTIVRDRIIIMDLRLAFIKLRMIHEVLLAIVTMDLNVRKPVNQDLRTFRPIVGSARRTS
jgi:hypothetical protein